MSAADLALLHHDETTVLLARHVTPVRARALDEQAWGGYADAAGNASLRASGLVIRVTVRSSPSVACRPPRPFSHGQGCP